MNWDTFARAMTLRYRMPGMKYRVRDANRILMAFLKRSVKPYVSFSAGKDSLVALDMALALRPDIAVVWHDEDWLPPGTVESVEAAEQFYGIRILRVRERHAADEWYARYGQWPHCSQPRVVDFEADTWPEIEDHYGFDGAIIALRGDESKARSLALRYPLRWHKTMGAWRVSPVHDWTYMDVWSYILGRRLPFHPAYRQMIEAGVEPAHARIGPLTATRVYLLAP
jgi:3'-phosphoadenosine 5'-phosphosulfate sulfotransferase (PAPS reductase)/FAD synthetase